MIDKTAVYIHTLSLAERMLSSSMNIHKLIIFFADVDSNSYFELKSMPVKPGPLHHDESADIPCTGARLLRCLWNKGKITVLGLLP